MTLCVTAMQKESVDTSLCCLQMSHRSFLQDYSLLSRNLFNNLKTSDTHMYFIKHFYSSKLIFKLFAQSKVCNNWTDWCQKKICNWWSKNWTIIELTMALVFWKVDGKLCLWVWRISEVWRSRWNWSWTFLWFNWSLQSWFLKNKRW